ncbi:MAG: hypothetical protein ABH823_04365 [bacterium]
MTVKLARLDSGYLRSCQRQAREQACEIRTATLQTAREGISLRPIIARQRELVLGGLSRIFSNLTAPTPALAEEMLGVVSGSYARATCVVGTDLDIDFLYPNSQRPKLFPVEKAVIRTFARVFDYSRFRIHSVMALKAAERAANDESLFDPHGLARTLAGQGLALAGPLRGVNRLLGRGLGFVSWRLLVYSANRSPAMVLDVMQKETRAHVPMVQFDTLTNFHFVFGSSQSLAELRSAREELARSHQETARLSLACKFLQRHAQQAAAQAANPIAFNTATTARTEDFLRFLKANVLYIYYHLLALENTATVSIVGPGDRKELEQLINRLLSVKSVIGIERPGNCFLSPPARRGDPFSQNLISQVARHLGEKSGQALLWSIQHDMRRATDIIESSYASFFYPS